MTATAASLTFVGTATTVLRLGRDVPLLTTPKAARRPRAIPVHHDDYGVFRSPLSDFLRVVGDAGLRDTVTVVKRGHTVEL